MLYDILTCKSSSFMTLPVWSGLNSEMLFGMTNIGHDRPADSEFILTRFDLILVVRQGSFPLLKGPAFERYEFEVVVNYSASTSTLQANNTTSSQSVTTIYR
jgi:hypothetical protein